MDPIELNNINHADPNATQHTSPQQVEVNQSKQDFEKMNQELSEAQRTAPNNDVEKATGFDMQAFFEDSVRARTDRGGKLKKMGVITENLTVVGQGADATSIPDNLSPLKGLGKLLWPPNWFRRGPEGTAFNILTEINSFVKDGEMLLVLGRPGAGCSTYLRVLTNERGSYLSVDGSVTYGGIPSEDFGRYVGEAVYAPEEDSHFPTLNVRETLDFALKMKTPGDRLPDETKRNFREKMFNTLLSMFGLKNQADTTVGDEWIRGLSGGERKRLTIAEAMVSQAAINCWDCSTRGLDAASALDYARSLRVMSDVLHKTTIATFYQASESIYKLFDRVLILDKGRCIFFGKTSEAKDYFLSLGFDCEPRKSIPDFLTGITNPQERKIRPGFEGVVPTNAVALEAAFKASKFHQIAQEELKAYKEEIEREQPAKDFIQEVKDTKAWGARKKSIYNANIFTQAVALSKRQASILWGDKFGIISRYTSIIIQALIYGSVFYQLPLNSAGGYGRGGALFSAIIQNSLVAQAALPAAFHGRRVLQKQKSYAMYHPASLHVAQLLTDIPITLLQVVLFSIITYFMYGLDLDAGKFFVYLFTLFITSMCITNLFRLLGNLSPSLFASQQVMGALFCLMLTYCGFFIPYYKMRPWLIWVHWINPMAYSFKALYLNEMNGVQFDCSENGYFPYGPAYVDPAYRVCALPGAIPGSTTVTGPQYVVAAYEFNIHQMSINVFAIFCIWVLLSIWNAMGMEYLEWVEGGYTKKVYRAGLAPKQNDAQAEELQAKSADEASEKMNQMMAMKSSIFMWKDIKYTVPVKGGTRLLLDEVGGWIKPGQMTALMGSSGAGKTTLLDVLAQRKTQGKVEGTMLLNGNPLQKDFERITGYVEQMDVHNPFVTVREALQFSARLRQERDVPDKEKMDYVEKVLMMMEMTQLGEALIGSLDSGVGISVEERKRLTIGMELVARPHILFLDEPTSGLDAQSSFNIIKFTRKLADAGMPLVCTIHQPSSVLFEHFDRLLLLARGGKTVYFGDIGEKSSTLLNYFESNGARHCTEDENPAEYILEAIGAGVHGNTDKDWSALWKSSDMYTKMNEELETLSKTSTEKVDGEKAKEFSTGAVYQFWLLFLRLQLVFWRNPMYNTGRILQSIVVGLIIGFSFWNLDNSTSDLQLRILAIFLILILGIMLIIAAQPGFMLLRALFRRDFSSKFYGWGPFSLSMIVVELPYLVLAATLCVVCSYWSVGLDSSSYNGFYFWIAFVLFMFFSVSFGQMMAAMTPNITTAMLILPIFATFLFLFAGVLAPPSQMPKFWSSWMYPLDPYHYFLEGVVTDVFVDLKVECTERDLFKFRVPPGETCGSYTESFRAIATGYFTDLEATDFCSYCQFKDGKEFYQTLEWSADHRWRNFGILWGFWAFNIAVGTFFIWYFRKQAR